MNAAYSGDEERASMKARLEEIYKLINEATNTYNKIGSTPAERIEAAGKLGQAMGSIKFLLEQEELKEFGKPGSIINVGV
jgi:hypothetical protein